MQFPLEGRQNKTYKKGAFNLAYYTLLLIFGSFWYNHSSEMYFYTNILEIMNAPCCHAKVDDVTLNSLTVWDSPSIVELK